MKKKIVSIIILLLSLTLLILWGISFYKINKQYTNPKIISGKINQTYTHMGRNFTLKKYTIKELDSLLNDLNLTRSDVTLEDNLDINVMLVHIHTKELENFNDYKNFDIMTCVVESGAWFNGVDRELFLALNNQDAIDSAYDNKQNQYNLILPFTMYKSRFSQKSWNNLNSRNYQFVFNWFPTKNIIEMQ